MARRKSKIARGPNIGVKAGLMAELQVVRCKGWEDFRERSKGASSVALEWSEEEGLTISSLSRGVVYRYVLESDGVKSWLSWELGVPGERVVEGEIMLKSKNEGA